jgi:UDP-N-acetyl-D-glucosamine dehydrogenase
MGGEKRSAGIDVKSIASFDCVVIATAHSAYDFNKLAKHAALLFDTRGVTRQIKSKNIIRLGE